jgi:hypothetical protein
MNQGYYDKKIFTPKKAVYYFNGLGDYMKYMDDTMPKLTGNARRVWDGLNSMNDVRRRAADIDWFGTSDVQSVMGQKTSFLFNNELNTFLQSLRSSTINTDITDIDQQKKIEFTERELGIFSFDLASLGLIRVFEYYSPLLNKIIDADYVRSYKVEDDKYVFYHVKMEYVARHKIEYSIKEGGFYSKVLKRLVDTNELEKVVTDFDIEYFYPEVQEIPQHDVERRQQVDEDGNLKFATTFKKCFIHIPKVKGNLPRIDLIITSSYGSRIKATNQMIWNAMAGIAVAEKLTKSNVNYRIIAAFTDRVGDNARTQKDSYTFVKIKDENQPLDTNAMATLLSDGRFFRWDTFRGSLATMWDAGYDSDINSGISATINETSTDTPIKDAYIKYLKSNKGYSDQEAAKVTDSKIVFRQALNEPSAIAEYNRVIQQISRI